MNALTETDSFALFAGTHDTALPRPRFIHTSNINSAVAFAETCAQVVAKVSGVAHKTEVGGVRVGLHADSLAACFDELAALGDGTVLVVEQVSMDVELIVGAMRDEQFGIVITVGLGGVLTEALNDVAVMLAPTEPGDLDYALDHLRAAALLGEFRGRAALDRHALQAIVDAVSAVMTNDASVLEIDLNPVGVVNGQPMVLDCLVVKQETS
jgi:ATP-grasp domain